MLGRVGLNDGMVDGARVGVIDGTAVVAVGTAVGAPVGAVGAAVGAAVGGSSVLTNAAQCMPDRDGALPYLRLSRRTPTTPPSTTSPPASASNHRMWTRLGRPLLVPCPKALVPDMAWVWKMTYKLPFGLQKQKPLFRSSSSPSHGSISQNGTNRRKKLSAILEYRHHISRVRQSSQSWSAFGCCPPKYASTPDPPAMNVPHSTWPTRWCICARVGQLLSGRMPSPATPLRQNQPCQ